ncbi:MAG: radical SAM protein, partial [Myxococcales bacterium]|nr:radical SAM protein [Myxococcales bacterium]
MRRPRMLMVYPRFARNLFLNFEYMLPFIPGKKAVIPSLGLLAFAGRVRDDWDLRLVDEHVREVTDDDLAWADVVAVSGMHPQRARIEAIVDRANAAGCVSLVGGPSVSICPEYYPRADYLHLGELGDGTDALLERLHQSLERPAEQEIFATRDKTPLSEQPIPAYDLIDTNHYILMPLQFSVGCPYTCEFCDIPAIYGSKARLKSPERVVAEMQAIYDTGFIGTILFVDDNLIAHKGAVKEMLPSVIAWQEAHRFPYPLSAEASINIARDEALLELLREARCTHMFLGVESPDPDTLVAISKRQNIKDPLLSSIRKIQAHGMEVNMGMIFGFDTDTERSGQAMTRFIEAAQSPVVYFNLLAALPKTPLFDRLEREGRLLGDDHKKSDDILNCLDTNVDYVLPNEVVERMLLETVEQVYASEAVYERTTWNLENVNPQQRLGVPPLESVEDAATLARYTLGTLSLL